MAPRLVGHFSIFGWVFFVRKSRLGIARQWSRKKFAILTLKPRSQVRIILIYQMWPIPHDWSQRVSLAQMMSGVTLYVTLCFDCHAINMVQNSK